MLIPIDSIVIAPGHRRINQAKVKELAVSIQTIGLKTPITVRRGPDGSFILVAGRHRIEACRKLGQSQIEATAVGDDELDADLWETAENLHRAELTAVQHTVAQAEWVKLVAKKIKRDQKVNFRQVGGNPGPGRPTKDGVTAAAKKLGVAETSARRAINIADNLTDAARREAEQLGLDNNQRALEAACKVGGGHEQIRALHRFIKRKEEKASARKEAKERKIQREAMPATASTALAPTRKLTPQEAFDRWYWSLDVVERTELRIWLLGADLEAYFKEQDRIGRMIAEDRQALH